MTTLLICSDLHTNHHRDAGKSIINSLYDKDVDIAVIAGDLSGLDCLEDNLKQLCSKYPQVVYVVGNHEYYLNSFKKTEDAIAKIESRLSNLTWLNNKHVVVSGVPFIGATLWFGRSELAIKGIPNFSDFYYITDCDTIAFDRHDATVKYFQANMQKDDIVVTHHLPSYKSVGLPFIGSPLNCYFASHQDVLIIDKKPALYIHGHTHIACDYMLGSTRICCNPFGTPRELAISSSYFDDSFTIEV